MSPVARLSGYNDFSGTFGLLGNNIVGSKVFTGAAFVKSVQVSEIFKFSNPAPNSTILGGDMRPGVYLTDGAAVPLLPGGQAENSGDASVLPPDTHDLDQDGNTTEPLPLDAEGRARIIGQSPDLGAVETEPYSFYTGTNGADNFYGAIIGPPINDFAEGRGGNDVLLGGLGDDILLGGTGNNIMVGGEGHGLVILTGNWQDYVITELDDVEVSLHEQSLPGGYSFDGDTEVVRIASPDGFNIVQAEYFRFDDRTLASDELLSGGGPAYAGFQTFDVDLTYGSHSPVDIAAILAELPAIFTPDGFDLLGL